MVDIIFISGSIFGGVEYVVEYLVEKLEEAGFIIETLYGSLLEDLFVLGIWLVISFIYGVGDISDNFFFFYEVLQEQKFDFFVVRFGVIGIGSREYDIFCGVIDKFEVEFKNFGVKQIGEILKINIFDYDISEDSVEEWLGSWVNLFK